MQVDGHTADGGGDCPNLPDLEELYDTHHRLALALAYRIVGSQAEAEDVIQEVFLAAWRAGHTYDAARGSVRTWLLTMVRHRAIDVLRGRGRRPLCVLREDLDWADDGDLAGQVARNVDGQMVRRATASLSPEQREVIELAYFAGLSHSEIATQLALPLGTVKGRMRLGLNHLRTALGSPHEGPVPGLATPALVSGYAQPPSESAATSPAIGGPHGDLRSRGRVLA